MSLSTVLFLFLAHLGVGIVFTLVFVSREAGVKFFRFNAGLAAILLVVALAFRYGTPFPGGGLRSMPPACSRSMRPPRAVVLYWATVGRMLATNPAGARRGGRRARARRRGRSGARDVDGPRAGRSQALTVASFLSSAALLGGACTAMILGHWYLVIPSMEVSHLQSIVKVHIASMVVRVAVVGARPWSSRIATLASRAGLRASATTSCRSTASSSGSACCSASRARRCCRI